MGQICSLSGRRRAAPRRLWRPAIFLLAVLLLCYLLFNVQLYPALSALACARAEKVAQELIAGAFARQLAESAVAYEDLVCLTYRADGQVATLQCRMTALNQARNALFLSVLEGFSAAGEVVVEVPLGNLLGGDAFSGRGPALTFRVVLAQGATAYMESDFSSCGINQTLHRVLFSVSLHLTVLTPSHPTETTVTQTFCVCETVIVGDVPAAYMHLSRLTEPLSAAEVEGLWDTDHSA